MAWPFSFADYRQYLRTAGRLPLTRRVWAAFGLFCALAGSAWIWDESFALVLTGLPKIALHQGVLAGAFAIAALLRRSGSPAGRPGWRLMAAAVGMFALPEIMFAGSSGHVSQLTNVLVFLLVPVVVMVASGQKARFGLADNPLGMVVPALVGLGGAALVLPFALPVSIEGRAWLGATVLSAILAGLSAVWMHDLLRGKDVLSAASAVGAATAIAAAIFGWSSASGAVWSDAAAAAEAARCLLIDAPMLALTVWLLRDMPPVAFSARFLLIPVVTIVESYLLLRPAASWTTFAGVAMMAGAGVWLVRADSREML